MSRTPKIMKINDINSLLAKTGTYTGTLSSELSSSVARPGGELLSVNQPAPDVSIGTQI